MSFVCEHCHARLAADHQWQGLLVGCPACGRSTTLQFEQGKSIPVPSRPYSLSYHDFVQLLEIDPRYSKIQSQISAWLQCTFVESSGKSLAVLNSQGELIPYQFAHELIQSNNAWRHDLYQEAMTLWR